MSLAVEVVEPSNAIHEVNTNLGKGDWGAVTRCKSEYPQQPAERLRAGNAGAQGSAKVHWSTRNNRHEAQLNHQHIDACRDHS